MDHPGSAAQRGRAGQGRGATHAGRAGHHQRGRMPLVGGTRAGGQRLDIAVGEQGAGVAIVAADREADVGDGRLAAGGRALAEQQTRLEGRERDRALGGPHRPAQDLAREPVEPAGYVDGQHRGVGPTPLRRRIGPRQARAEGGVDVKVRWGQRLGPVCGREHANPHASSPELAGRGPPVGAVVAGSGQNHHAASVPSAHHRHRGAGHSRAGPLNQHLGRFGRGRVDLSHPSRRNDRNHRASAMTVAWAR